MSGDVPRAQPPPGWPPAPRYGQESVAIANDGRGIVQRSVESLASLPGDLPRAALVGGLAVMVRLYEAHRATTDFDEVSEGRDETIDLLVAQGATRTANGVYLADKGVQLDLIDASADFRQLRAYDSTAPIGAPPAPAADVSPAHPLLDEAERNAVQLALVCRYALETAVRTQVFVVDREQVVAQVTMPVALAGSLVAMKVHAAVQLNRPADKSAGDIYDAYRLIRAWGPSVIAEDLSRAPLGMLDTTAAQITELFDAGVERSARRLRAASIPGIDAVAIDDLAEARRVVDALAPFRQWDPPTGEVTALV